MSAWLGLYGSVVMVCVICFCVIWPMRIAGSRFDIANVLLLFVAYYFLMFGLYGLMNAFGLSHYLGVSYNPTSDSLADISSLASVYAGGLLLSVYAGYIWVPQLLSRRQSVRSREAQSWLDLRNLNQLGVAASIALAFSYIGCALMIFFLGGFSAIGLDPTYVATTGTHGLYWVQALIWTNHWAVLVNLLGYILMKKNRYLILTALSIPLFFVEFLLSGSKSALLFPLIGFLIVRHYCYRRITWRPLVALGAAVLIVFAAGYAYRSTGAQASQFEQGVASYYQNPVVLLETIVGRFYGTDGFAIVLDSVRNGQPLLMGKSFSDLLTWYIPRWLWPAKPLSFSLTFGEDFMAGAPGAGDVYYSPSLPGELYLNFGVVGLLLGGIVTGRFLRFMYRKLIEQRPRRIEAIVLYAVIAPLAASLSGGPISVILEFIMTRVILFALFFWIAGIVTSPALLERSALARSR
ncbi:MAG TPA: O-antigen polymerase [Terriglobales bacterium]|nr:O-antigen polymerase [Terriglobales bacterium]